MPSKVIKLRVNEAEQAMFKRLCGGNIKRNRSELIRFWLHREYNRITTRRSVVADSAVATDWRTGRPRGRKVEAAV
jgi:hypothetical protein